MNNGNGVYMINCSYSPEDSVFIRLDESNGKTLAVRCPHYVQSGAEYQFGCERNSMKLCIHGALHFRELPQVREDITSTLRRRHRQ